MAKFINIDNDTVINISEIVGIQRELFDLADEDFIIKETNAGGEIELGWLDLPLAKVSFGNGKDLVISTTIYPDEDYIEQINNNWDKLISCLKSELILMG